MSVNEHQSGLPIPKGVPPGMTQCLLQRPADTGGTFLRVLWLPAEAARVGRSVTLKGETDPWTVAEVWGNS
jgi:hypothetical protein